MEQYAKQVAKNNRTKPTLLVIASSEPGNGKTHSAQAVVTYFENVAIDCHMRGWWPQHRDAVPTGLFIQWPELFKLHNKPVWDEILAADLLALDDIGAEVDQFRSGAPTEALRQALEKREGMFTIVTTNILPKQWASRWDARVEDRLLRRADRIVLTTPSYARRKL